MQIQRAHVNGVMSLPSGVIALRKDEWMILPVGGW